jgi:hypothetical protein
MTNLATFADRLKTTADAQEAMLTVQAHLAQSDRQAVIASGLRVLAYIDEVSADIARDLQGPAPTATELVRRFDAANAAIAEFSQATHFVTGDDSDAMGEADNAVMAALCAVPIWYSEDALDLASAAVPADLGLLSHAVLSLAHGSLDELEACCGSYSDRLDGRLVRRIVETLTTDHREAA